MVSHHGILNPRWDKRSAWLPLVDVPRAVRVHPPALAFGDQRHLGRLQAVALLAVH